MSPTTCLIIITINTERGRRTLESYLSRCLRPHVQGGDIEMLKGTKCACKVH